MVATGEGRQWVANFQALGTVPLTILLKADGLFKILLKILNADCCLSVGVSSVLAGASPGTRLDA